MKNLLPRWAIIALLPLLLVSCEPTTEEPDPERECHFTIETPVGLQQATYSDLVVLLKSNRDGEEVKLTPTAETFTQVLLDGTYRLSLTAKLTYRSERLGQVETSIATEETIIVSESATDFAITPAYQESASSGFVIEELFFSPTVDPETGKNYSYKEQYIKITNNSDVTLYADSLGIVESHNLSNMKRDYTDPDALEGKLPVGFFYMIPGDGKSHPIEPGGSIIIANDAQDHSKFFTGAINLEKADFEIYDLSSNPNFQDSDNPSVPNLVPYYKASLTVSSFHQRGCTAIALVRVPVDPETYARDFAWSGKYIFKFNEFVKEMEENAFQVPHAWIQDLVYLGIQDEVEWRFMPETFDAGFTGWLDSSEDKTGQGTAVIRKISREEGGRKYLKDTNNSTEDFERRVSPSLKTTPLS